MKYFYLFICITGISTITVGQNINFPDEQFKNYMVFETSTDSNGDGEISLQEASNISYLTIDGFGEFTITDLGGIEHFVNLESLSLEYLSAVIDAPNLLPLTQLTYFTMSSCSFSGTIDLSASDQLSTVNVYSSQITNIKLNASQLGEVLLTGNQLSDMTIVGTFNAMPQISIGGNQFTNLDFFANLPDTGFYEFSIYDEPLPANVDLTGIPSGGYNFELICNTMQHVKIPPYLQWTNRFQVEGANLLSVDMKNGYIDAPYYDWLSGDHHYIINSPVLQSVCVDDITLSEPGASEIISEANYIRTLNGLPDEVLVSSYCDLTNGPNTITGTVNADCQGAYPMSGIQLNITGPGALYNNSTLLNPSGYSLYAYEGPVTITPELINPSWYTISPASHSFDFESFGETVTANFCITPNGVHPDLEVSILPITPARPGFNSNYLVSVRNQGNVPLTGEVTFNYDDTVFDYVTASPSAASQSNGTMTWNFQNLQPLSNASFTTTLNLNSPTEVPAVNIGDELEFAASVSPMANDETPSNNSDDLKQDVVGSFDPNDKQVLEGETVNITQIGEFLHYIVRFQNNGSAPAEFVVISDTISAKLDINTFEVITSSHEMRTNISYGNKVEFFFEDINLPPSSTDEPASNGFVAFRIKPKSTVVLNDVIENKADIFFDFNFPIETNTVSTTFTTLGTAQFNANFSVYPNPASSVLNVKSDNAPIINIAIFDILGQKMSDASVNENSSAVDVSQLQSGIYFVSIETGVGKAVRKFVKK